MYSTQVNLHFIRHAETTFNFRNEAFKENNPQCKTKNFDQLSQIRKFREEVRFCKQQIDCSITQKGRRECQKAKKQLEQKQIKPDLILVSPFNRTLETCHYIFGNEVDIPIVIEPLIGEISKSSCDVAHQIQHKKNKFKKYNFDQCQKLGNHWYITKNSLRHKQLYFDLLDQNESLPHSQTLEQILHRMDHKDLVETQQDLLQRCNRALQKIHEVYSPKYKQIVLISHFMFMDCISASKYDQNCVPLNGIKTKNCQVHTTKLSNLLQKN